MRKMLFCLLFVIFAQSSFAQDRMDMAKEFPCSKGCFNDYSNPNAKPDALCPVEYARLQEIFEDISKNSGIEFNYPQAACQQRTQYLSMLLTKKYQLDHFRVWLFAPVNLYKESSEHLEIKDINDLSENGVIKWKYHVAPAVKIKDTVVVIDPSLKSERPMTLDEWLKPFSNSKTSKYSFISSEYYFFYQAYDIPLNPLKLLDVISGQFYTYGKTPQDLVSVEKGLAINDTAMSIYRKYILPLKTSNSENDKEKLKQLKQVFGNFNNLEILLTHTTKTSGQFGNTNFREFYTNHGEIATEAGRIYLERTLFWTKKVNELLK